jgi:hypothetical protein
MRTTQSDVVKVEFRGKTRKLVSNHADAAFSGSELVNDVLSRENTNAVLTSREEINELQRLLEQIQDNPNYNGHMDRYVTRTNRKLEAAKGWF